MVSGIIIIIIIKSELVPVLEPEGQRSTISQPSGKRGGEHRTPWDTYVQMLLEVRRGRTEWGAVSGKECGGHGKNVGKKCEVCV